jgi:glycosyltransferase involved in cell wall biosynthesis
LRVLLYAPDLPGHPQVYCRVIARALLNAGSDHQIFIANPFEKEGWVRDWPVLRPLADESRVHALKLGLDSAVMTAEKLIELQRKHRIDSTLFIVAENLESEFRRIAAGQAPRWHGRVCGIFDRTCEWYPREDAYSGAITPWYGLPLRHKIGRVKRALLHHRESPSYFYEQVLIKSRTVDALIVKDERIARKYGPPVSWMPEIFRVLDDAGNGKPGDDFRQHAEPIRRFIQNAGADNVLLYFGTGAWYKGYDWLLRLARSDRETFVLHAGAPARYDAGKAYDVDVEDLRAELLAEGRLYETRSFIESDALVQLVFSSITRFVSTHRLTLSSGTCLQALEQGKPILTPSAGLVGWRTREYGLGSTYTYADMDAMSEAWRNFRQGLHDPKPGAIESFMSRFSREATEIYFVRVLTGAL